MIGAALLRAQAGVISHMPAPRGGEAGEDVDWVELLCDGLTFDLIGIAPGRGLAPVAPVQTLGIAEDDLADSVVMGLAPGPHLAGAAHSLPVVKTMLRLGIALLAHTPGNLGAFWRPGGLATDTPRFLPPVQHWLTGGPFPAPLLIRLAPGDAGMDTRGLDFFLGRELRLLPAWGEGKDAVRVLTRVVDRLIASVNPSEADAAVLDDGTRVRLIPEGRIITIAPG